MTFSNFGEKSLEITITIFNIHVLYFLGLQLISLSMQRDADICQKEIHVLVLYSTSSSWDVHVPVFWF